MYELINYFENIPTIHRSILIVGGITIFWFLEGLFPLVRFNYKKWQHAIPNFFFTLTTIVINLSMAFLLLKTSDWTIHNDFGLLQWIPGLTLWGEIILGVLLLDFVGAYLPHYTEHRIKPLWMIHLVHHSDPNVDTTTANRHHPLESIIRFSFTLLGVFITGTSIGIVMFYQALSLLSTQFNHANIRLPKSLISGSVILSFLPTCTKFTTTTVCPILILILGTSSPYGTECLELSVTMKEKKLSMV